MAAMGGLHLSLGKPFMMSSRNSSIIGSTAAADWMLFRMLSCVRSSDEPEMSPTTAFFVVNVLGPSPSSSDALAWSTGERESASASWFLLSWDPFGYEHESSHLESQEAWVYPANIR